MAFDKDKFWAHVREPIANLLYAGKMKKELMNFTRLHQVYNQQPNYTLQF